MGRQKARKPKRVRPDRPLYPPQLDPAEMRIDAQLTRSTCTSCGSDHLHWADLGQAVSVAATDFQRGAFTEAVAAGIDSTSDAWWCMDCDAVGIFSPLMWA